MKRKIAWTLGVAGLHAVITMGLLLFMLGLSGAAFDGERSRGILDTVGGGALQVLMFPIVSFVNMLPRDVQIRITAGGLENVAFYLNSLLWGAALVMAFSRRRGLREGP
jgi:hypothetical protein